MLGGLFAGFVVFCVLMVSLHLLQYIALRIRNEAAPERDPHLGRKFVLHLFQHFSILLVLSGFTISAIDVTDSILLPMQTKANAGVFGNSGRGGIFFDDDFDDGLIAPGPGFNPNARPSPLAPTTGRIWWNTAQRFAVGLVLSGLLHGSVLFAVILLGTNNSKFPAVGRAFGATRLVISGIILMGCSTIMIISVLQKGSTDYRGLSMVIGMLFVWGPMALGHLFWMRWTMNPATKKAIKRPKVADDEDWEEDPERRPPRKGPRAAKAPRLPPQEKPDVAAPE